MKTDQQLKFDVLAELDWESAIDATGIGVAVKDGVVTLGGQVETYLQKLQAERAVRRVSGVRGLAVELEVTLAPGHRRGDADIAQAALAALQWHSLVPDERVQVKVEEGHVTLAGAVDYPFQRQSAEECVRPLIGVKGVTNRIELTHRVDPTLMKAQIGAAFERHARREARHIEVNVDGGVVTLRGKVDTLAEHDAAVGTAWAAPGVTRVIDHLHVAA